MNEQQKRILKMVEEGKIKADEAEKLLSTLEEKVEKEENNNNIVLNKDSKLKGKLKIEVTSSTGDNVKISLPLKIAALSKNIIPKEASFMMSENGIDFNALLDNIGDLVDEINEDIVNVKSASGDYVRIYIEK